MSCMMLPRHLVEKTVPAVVAKKKGSVDLPPYHNPHERSMRVERRVRTNVLLSSFVFTKELIVKLVASSNRRGKQENCLIQNESICRRLKCSMYIVCSFGTTFPHLMPCLWRTISTTSCALAPLSFSKF